MDFFYTRISQNAIELASQVMRSTFVSEGIMVKRFEEKLADQLGIVNPVATNSGTSALHLALAIANIGPGDEVILPAQTFIATGLVVLMQHAKPVFADIQYETGNIDIVSIRKKITERTKAVIPVHWAGYPCDMEEILQLAQEHHIAVIEDAAHALGAVYKGRPVGSISRFTAFSFQAIKHLTTGDGGALCCNEKKDEHQARRRRWFDIDRANAKPSILGEREYDASEIGFKYHLNDLAAAVGLGNLEALSSDLQKRREIALKYRREFAHISGLKLLSYENDRESAYWIFTMLVEKREAFIRALKGRGVPASVVHLRIDKNSVFGGMTSNLCNQEKFNEEQISIPLHGGLSPDDVEQIIAAVKLGW